MRYDTPRTFIRSSLEQYDSPRATREVAQDILLTPQQEDVQNSSHPSLQHYDSPKPFYDSPRTTGGKHPVSTGQPKSLIKGIRGGLPSTKQVQPPEPSNCQEYDIPRSAITHIEIKGGNADMNSSGDRNSGIKMSEPSASDRSSGVSIMSCESQLSTSSSASSLQASESLSLSSLGGGSSNR